VRCRHARNADIRHGRLKAATRRASRTRMDRFYPSRFGLRSVWSYSIASTTDGKG